MALNFPIDTLLSAPRRLQKHRQRKRDENHEENGRQQDRHCQSRAATCISAFTAKPPGTMRENRRLRLCAPNNAAHGAEAASSGLSNRRATRGTRFVPRKLSEKGDDPVRVCDHYSRAASYLDPDQSSLFHCFGVGPCVRHKIPRPISDRGMPAIAGFCEIYRGRDFQKVSALKNF